MRNISEVTGGKPIVVRSQSISGGSAVDSLVFATSIEERERCYSFVLSRTPLEAKIGTPV
jgi:hypothetical protein